MLYSIQDDSGKVYGLFPMPETNKSAELLAHELRLELGDILGYNGVRDVQVVMNSETGEKEDRVVIDIEPLYGKEQERIERIQETIGRLTTPNPEY